jgi:hypothetical protein
VICGDTFSEFICPRPFGKSFLFLITSLDKNSHQHQLLLNRLVKSLQGIFITLLNIIHWFIILDKWENILFIIPIHFVRDIWKIYMLTGSLQKSSGIWEFLGTFPKLSYKIYHQIIFSDLILWWIFTRSCCVHSG